MENNNDLRAAISAELGNWRETALAAMAILSALERLGFELLYSSSPAGRFVKAYRQDVGDVLGYGDNFIACTFSVYFGVQKELDKYENRC